MGDTVGQRRINGVLGDIALHAEVVVIAAFFRQRPALDLHPMRDLPGTQNDFADAAHRLRIRRCQREGAEIVQNIFCRDGFPADTRFGKRHVFGDIRIEMVADHQHIQMFVDGVDGIGQRRVG